MIGWLDCAAGASGDMLLGALVDVGVPLATLQAAVDALGVGVTLRTTAVTRAGLGATRVQVEVPADDRTTRTWADVRKLLGAAALSPQVRERSLAVFGRLAAAEAAVHRVPVDEVHFHEVGGHDALADVVGVCAGLAQLGLTRFVASPVALGSGTTRGAHGPLPVPAPAVLALLVGVPVHAGAAAHEACTPTGAALLAEWVDAWGPLPPLAVHRVGTGAGGRDPAEVANVLRLVVGKPALDAAADATVTTAVVLETNVDDLDPRLWPGVLQHLLDLGAADAWLTPILMKKGRPAHLLSVLCSPALAPAVQEAVFRETSSLGVRRQQVTRTALARGEQVVQVQGQPVRVKTGLWEGEVVNAQPEWADVAAAAKALGLPAKQVLAAALAAYQLEDRP